MRAVLIKRIRQRLGEFAQQEEMYSGILGDFRKHRIDSVDYDKCRLLRYVFSFFLNFKILDKPFEKVNWEIPFTYKGHPCSCAHQKFGFRIYIHNRLPEKQSDELFKEIMNSLRKALDDAEPFIRADGLKMLKKGRIIINNRFQDLEERYSFFRDKAYKIRKQIDAKQNFDYKKEIEMKYLSEAAFVSFFSLIEHLCVLGFAFENRDQSKLEKVAAMNWSDKFKTVFSLNDGKMKNYYDDLLKLSKFRRNPTVHGYLDKLNTIFYFFSEHAKHRIPMNIYDRNIVLKTNDSNVNFKVIDAFLKHLRETDKTKRMMQYIDAGFDIGCDKDAVKEHKRFVALNDKESKQYIEYMQRMLDEMADMDW